MVKRGDASASLLNPRPGAKAGSKQGFGVNKMKNTSSQTATPINHGRIPYLCSAKTSTGYCTNNADVVLTTGSKAILCNKHYAKV